MTRRKFGTRTASPPEVTAIGLGAWPIGQKADGTGSYGVVAPEEGRAVVERYVELGGTFIDTARGYGTSEAIIGSCSFMQSDREKIFLATKTHHTKSMEELPQIERDLESSLRELRTDYVDLFQIHAPPEEPDLMERVLDEFVKLKERGLIRMIGASVKGPDVTPQTVKLAKAYIDTDKVDALQLIYSIYRRAHEETFQHAYAKGVAIIARTVLESGFLTGKYRAGAEFTDHRARWSPERREVLIAEAARLRDQLEAPYESLAQAAMRFALESQEVSVIIPGARSTAQVEANCAVDALPPLSHGFRNALEQLPDRIHDLANTG